MSAPETVEVDQSSRPLRQPDVGWAVTGMTWIIVVWLSAGMAPDPDLWGHLRFGLDVLAGRALPTIDPYSFTQDRPILYHEWLGAVLIALAYKVKEFSAIAFMKLALSLTAFTVLWRSWRNVHPLLTLPVMTITALAAAPLTRTSRPQIWTLLSLLALGLLLRRPATARRLLAVSALFAAWVNLHGGVVLGLGVVGVWSAVAALFEAWRQRSVPWMWVATPIAAAAATLLNPYGTDYWVFLLETVRPNRDIVEWQPLWTQPPQLWMPFLITVGGVVILRLWPSPPASAVLLMLWYAGATVSRIAYLAVPVTVLLIGAVAALRWPAHGWQQQTAFNKAAAGILMIPLAVSAVAVLPIVRAPFRCIPIGDQDPAGMARLEATNGEGRLVVWFDWGQYAIWHLSPRLKVSWDGRRETLYSEETQRVQKAVAFGLPDGDHWLTTVRPEYVWMPSSFEARRDWLTDNGYRLDHESLISYIAVRDDLPRLPDADARGSCVESP